MDRDPPERRPSDFVGHPRHLTALLLALLILGGLGAGSSPLHVGIADAHGLAQEDPIRLADRAEPGPHAVGRRVVAIRRADGPTFDATVWYPADGPPASTPRDDAPVLRASAPFPGIAFGHGFLQAPERYGGLLAHLATWGYVVGAPRSAAGIAPDHAAFSSDLTDTLTWLSEWTDGGEDPARLVDPSRLAVMGHSMGGGAAVLAAAADPRVAAVLTWAAAETDPSAVAAAAEVGVPSAYMVGDADRITPPAQHAGRMFEAGRSPGLLWILEGGSHCGFQTDPFPIGCDSGPLSREDQRALTRSRSLAFLDLYLAAESERRDWRPVWGPESSGGRVQSRPRPLVDVRATPVAARGHSVVPGWIAVRHRDEGRRRIDVRVEPGEWSVLPRADGPGPLPSGQWGRRSFEVAIPHVAPGHIGPDEDRALVSAWVDGRGLTRAWTWWSLRRTTASGIGGTIVLPWLYR